MIQHSESCLTPLLSSHSDRTSFVASPCGGGGQVDGTVPLAPTRKPFEEMSEEEKQRHFIIQSLRRGSHKERPMDARQPNLPLPLHATKTFDSLTNVAALQAGKTDTGGGSTGSTLLDAAVSLAQAEARRENAVRTRSRMEELGRIAGGNGTTGGTVAAREKANAMMHDGLDEWKDRLRAVRERWAADRVSNHLASMGKQETSNQSRRAARSTARQEASTRKPQMYLRPAELDYATWLLGQRRFQQAETLLEATLELQQEAAPANSMAIGWTYRTMGALQEAKGHLGRALRLREDSLRLMASVVDPTNPEIMHGLDLVAGNLVKLGLWQDAATIYSAAATELSGAHTDQRRAVYLALRKKADNIVKLKERQQLAKEDAQARALEAIRRDPWGEWSVAHGMTKQHMDALLTENNPISSKGRKAFKTFVKEEGGQVDALAFWLAAQDLKKLGTQDGSYFHACRRIYKHYIRPTNKLPMLTQGLRNELAAVIEASAALPQAKPDIYDQAQQLALEALFSTSYLVWMETDAGRRWFLDRRVCVQEPRKLKALVFFQRHAKRVVPLFVARRLAEEKAAREAELKRKAKEAADAMEAHARAVELFHEQQREYGERALMQAEEDAQRTTVDEEHHTPRPNVTFAFEDDLREVLD